MTERKRVLASSENFVSRLESREWVRHSVYPVHGAFPSVLFSLFSDHRLDRARRLAMPDEW
jgi:hypothetical protein